MDSNIRVKCCCIIGQGSDIQSLVACNNIFLMDMQNEARTLYQIIATQQNNSNIQQGPIQKIHSQSGAWYCLLRNTTWINLLVTNQFPMPSAMRLLKQIEELLKRQIATGKQDYTPFEAQIRDLLQQYDRNPDTDDKVEMISKSVDSVQGLMEENLKKFQYNQDALQVIHHKSADVTQMAQQFHKGAKAVNTKMACMYSCDSSNHILFHILKIFIIFQQLPSFQII
ncbi:hypothetical protein pb186bvf_003370 [Paramecium bursaria]